MKDRIMDMASVPIPAFTEPLSNTAMAVPLSKPFKKEAINQMPKKIPVVLKYLFII
jgi:hypothetical protein